MLQTYLPFTNEKFLWARRKISPSKYTRNPAMVRCNGNRKGNGLAGVYLVWSPCGLPVYPPTGGSSPRLSNATHHEQYALRRYQREGGAPTTFSGHPMASQAGRAVSSARGASGCHLTRDAGREQMREGRYDTIPMEGPPRTRMISLDEPPSSDTGRTYEVRANAAQIALHPVPPDMTRYDSDRLVSAPEVLSCCGGAGRCPAILGTGISRCGRCAARGGRRS